MVRSSATVIDGTAGGKVDGPGSEASGCICDVDPPTLRSTAILMQGWRRHRWQRRWWNRAKWIAVGCLRCSFAEGLLLPCLEMVRCRYRQLWPQERYVIRATFTLYETRTRLGCFVLTTAHQWLAAIPFQGARQEQLDGVGV